jgi:hypothetical protein
MRRTWIVVWVFFLLATSAFGRGGTPASMAGGEAVSLGWQGADDGGLVGALSGSLTDDERRQLMRALGKAIGAYAAQQGLVFEFDEAAYQDDRVTDMPFCAFVSGSAGTARLGGGGTLRSFEPGQLQGRVPEGGWPSAASPQRALVIVDDFGEGPFGHRYPDRDQGRSALLDLQDGDLQRLRDAVFGATASVRADHGSIVLFHVLAMLGAGGASVQNVHHPVSIESTANYRITQIDVVGGAPVLVASFDFLDLDSLADAMREVEGLLAGAPAVYNLSWNLADCTILELFRRVRADTDPREPEVLYRDFMRALIGNDPHVMGDVIAVCEAVLGRLGEDPIASCADLAVLEALVHTSESLRAQAWLARFELHAFDAMTGNTIVAASGNESLPFPLAPAAWRCVIGVAATEYGSTERAAWSNLGDFVVDEDATELGAYFSSGIPGVRTGEVLFYGGTSFAAPVVALAVAAGTHPGVDAGCAD